MISNYSILPFYDSIDDQHHKKWYAFNRGFSLITEIDFLPTFQIVRNQTGAAITSLKLIEFKSGTETDILNNALSTGLEVAEYTEYDLIIYPSILALSVENIKEGAYYLQMSDGVNNWFSEVFSMCADLTDKIKIEYWHGEDFILPDGHIRYNYPFKSRIYISSDIGKPSYEYEEQVIKRDGYTFPTQQISYKLHRFVALLPEYLIDAIRLIRMHDSCQIFYSGDIYTVNELLMSSSNWQQQGNVAEVEIEFKTDTIVVINGRGLNSGIYELQSGNCIPVGFPCVAKIDEGSPEYLGNYWLDGGAQISLKINDFILKVKTSDSKIVIEQWDGTSYVAVSSLDNQSAFDQRTNEYWFFETDSFKKPYINSASYGVVMGKSFINTVVNIFAVNSVNLSEIKVGTGFSSELQTTGINFNYVLGFDQIKIKSKSVNCENFEESQTYNLQGVGFGEIGNNFLIN